MLGPNIKFEKMPEMKLKNSSKYKKGKLAKKYAKI